jgi:hypothetical protein
LSESQEGSRKRSKLSDVSQLILQCWRSNRPTSIPDVNDLAQYLESPLEDDAKLPIPNGIFDTLICPDIVDRTSEEDVQMLFRRSELELSTLSIKLCSAVLEDPPSDDASELSFLYFWDRNIQTVVQTLIPLGKVIRNSSSMEPDFGFVHGGACLFRGRGEITQRLQRSQS